MRSGSSSKHTTRCIEMNRPKLKEEPQLSSAYIQSLVKQLSSSRAKEPSSPDFDQAKFSDAQEHSPPPPPPPQLQRPKKQVRRRFHTSRPYQERLLNMAEARREIVTALKYHRAAMKQATERNHSHPPQQIQSPPPPLPLSQSSPPPPPLEDSHIIINPRIYQSNYTTQNQTPFACPSYCWAYPSVAPLPNISDSLNLPLPNQPFGLNLNFHGFNNIEIPLNKQSIPHSLSYQSPSSPSTSYSYSYPPASTSSLSAFDPPGAISLHPAMDDEEMREIRSISEQHDMVWNDTMNLVTSALWSKFLKTMEVGPGDGLHTVIDEAMVDVPALSASDDCPGGDPASLSCLLPQYFDDCEGYLQDDALSCFDIGELEGLDGDWLS